MSNEEFNRKMEFIVEQQAQFTADIQIMREVHKAEVQQLREQDRNLWAVLRALADTVAEAQRTTGAQISALTENVAVLTKDIAGLTEAGRRTDERLNVLINTVERHISGNGKQPSGDSV